MGGWPSWNEWLAEPEDPQPFLPSVLSATVVLALLSGRSAQRYLDRQRTRHLARDEGTGRRPPRGMVHTGRCPLFAGLPRPLLGRTTGRDASGYE